MVGLNVIGSLVAGAVAGIAIILVLEYLRKKQLEKVNAARYGSEEEKSIVAEAGLTNVEIQESKLESSERDFISKEIGLKSAERIEAKKMKGDLGAFEAIEAAEEGAEAARHEEAAEAAATAIEERSIGVEASIKKLIKDIVDYTAQKKNNVITEEQNISVLQKISEKITGAAILNDVDDKLNEYLKEYIAQTVAGLQQDLQVEGNKQESMEKLSKEMKRAVNVMKTAVEGAKLELKELKKEDVNTMKFFIKELKNVT